MANNYYLIDSPLQSVSGSNIAELFEIKPTSTYINNLGITTGGGYDTIKISDSSSLGFDAVITDYNSATKIDRSGMTYGTSSNPLLFWNRADGKLMKDTNGKISVKLLNYTGDVSFTDSPATYLLTQTSTSEGDTIYGTDYDDEITVNHPRNTVIAGRNGDGYGKDTVTANTDRNFIRLGYDNDLGILHGNNNTVDGSTRSYYVSSGNDTLISDGNNNYLFDGMNNNLFISGGDESTVIGGAGQDTINIYSYGQSANVTVTGGGNNDEYVLTTGFVGVKGENFLNAWYNSANNDTINVAITDLDSLDTIFVRNKNMVYLRHDVAAEGIYIKDNTGRVNIFLPNQRDWNVVKDTKVTFEDMNGNKGTLTLEQAENLPIVYPPAGVNVDGYNITVTSAFSGGELWMAQGLANLNYNNQNINYIDASPNGGTMLIAANTQPNSIKAGAGQTSLWGGFGNVSDTLVSGGGQTMFWYSMTEGNDVIGNAHDYDTIYFYDVTLNDVTSVDIHDRSFSIGFKTGNFLTVNDNGGLTPKLQIADGSSYIYNRVTGTWG